MPRVVRSKIPGNAKGTGVVSVLAKASRRRKQLQKRRTR